MQDPYFITGRKYIFRFVEKDNAHNGVWTACAENDAGMMFEKGGDQMIIPREQYDAVQEAAIRLPEGNCDPGLKAQKTEEENNESQ